MSGVSEFWRFLGVYEQVTIQEAVALSEKDFEKLDRLSDYKKEVLEKMVLLGSRHGLDRSNHELRQRLEALEVAERMNAESAGLMMQALAKEQQELSGSVRKLSSLRGAYAPGGSESTFFAEG